METDSITMTEVQLWIAAVIFAALDIVTTYYGLQIGLSEGNTLILPLFHSIGVIPAMVVAKVSAFAIAIGLRYKYLDKYAVIAPTLLALVWCLVVCINLTMLLTAVLQQTPV